MNKKHILLLALLTSSSIYAADIQFVKPYIGVETGMAFAEDDTKINFTLDGVNVLTIKADGAGAHGSVYGINTGFGASWDSIYAGLNGEYQKQDIEQSVNIATPDGSAIKSTGGMWYSYTASMRLGYYVLPQVLIFAGAGRAWSVAGSTMNDELTGEESKDTLHQDGWLWSMGTTIMPWKHWGIDFTAERVNYRSVALPSALSRIAKTDVSSKNSSVTVGISYHF